MRTVRVESELNCSVEAFWKLFFDRAFNEKLFLEGLRFHELEIVELTDTTRRIRCKPNVQLPRALQKLAGDSFGYEESGELKDGVWHWKVRPYILPDKVSNFGTVKVEPLGDDRCRRIDEMQVEAKVFGVGGMIEKTSEEQVTAAWRKTAKFMNEWLAR